MISPELIFLAGFVPLSAYLIYRKFRASARAIEAFEDAGVEEIHIAVERWQVPRILKRAEPLGWQLASETRGHMNCQNLKLKKANEQSATARDVFKSFAKSGFTFEPVRQDVCPGDCND